MIPHQKQKIPFSFTAVKQFAIKWTPRTIAACIGGFYSLGFAYDFGLMTAIDKAAIIILKFWLGHVGIGICMPTVQWYAAWTVRCLSAIGMGFIYDLIEKMIRLGIRWLKNKMIKKETYGQE